MKNLAAALLLLALSAPLAEASPHPALAFTTASGEVSKLLEARPAEPTTVHVVLTRGAQRLELDLPRDGNVAPEMADAIARIMRCQQSGRTRRIARGTLALLADVAVRFPGHEIEIISALRAEPERTQSGVKHSKHWTGHAIDLKVRDVKLTEVRDQMWKNHHDVGVGWYPHQGFIHLDYRPDIHDTAWTQPRMNANYVYHPRWAALARASAEAGPGWFDDIRNLVAGAFVRLATAR